MVFQIGHFYFNIKMKFILILLSCISWNLSVYCIGRSLKKQVLPNTSYENIITVNWFNQKLDHFNHNDTRTWNQVYILHFIYTIYY